MKNSIERGSLYCLWCPGQGTFPGYGLTVEPDRKDHLAGLLMVDRPQPADPDWLLQVALAFGEALLFPMTKTGERGIACQMWIDEESLPYVRPLPSPDQEAYRAALAPLLADLPKPQFELHWNPETAMWRSSFYRLTEKGRTLVGAQLGREPLFPLGQIVITPGALQALENAGQLPHEFLRRHVHGDWGELDEHDVKQNERALQQGLRLLSSYRTNQGIKLWVITEWDRSVTTLLLPAEY